MQSVSISAHHVWALLSSKRHCLASLCCSSNTTALQITCSFRLRFLVLEKPFLHVLLFCFNRTSASTLTVLGWRIAF